MTWPAPPAGRPVALITGAGSGIGAATARHLAGLGCDVALAWRSSAQGAKRVGDACRELGGGVMEVQADVACDAQCRAAVAAVLERWGRLDHLVNNAGTTRFAPARDLEALGDEDFATLFSVNVTGAYRMVRAAAPALARGHGSVVNLSSHAGFSGLGSSTAYAATKGALNTLTLSLARALAPEIRVNAVCPGFVDTAWMAPALEPRALADFKARSAATAPLRRIVTPEDVAEAVGWLALGGRSITGQLLVVDAGTHLAVATPL